MIIQSELVQATLTKKAQSSAQDPSRHLLCPDCRVRTKLYALKDGRRKCSACGKKFNPEKKTDGVKLKQYADLLLCFCLDFSAKQASDLTKYRYRLVSEIYDEYRMLLAGQNLTPDQVSLLTSAELRSHTIHDSAFCKRCKSRLSCNGRKEGDSPIFGVKILATNRAYIDPLPDEEVDSRFDQQVAIKNIHGKYAAYAGFICRGKFHRFADNKRMKDGAEQLWSWMHERLQKHHGIWKKNTGLYLKELEWKYNNRLLSSETQAMKIADLMPNNFLAAWGGRGKIRLDLVQKSD